MKDHEESVSDAELLGLGKLIHDEGSGAALEIWSRLMAERAKYHKQRGMNKT